MIVLENFLLTGPIAKAPDSCVQEVGLRYWSLLEYSWGDIRTG